MQRGLVILFVLMMHLGLSAQILVSMDTLKFGNVIRGSFASKSLTIHNNFDFDVTLEFIATESVYESDPPVLMLKSKSNNSINVIFVPKHNISYHSELLISTNSPGGATAVHLFGEGEYKESYYATTKNLWEEDLKKELKSIISKNYVNLGYNGARDAMYADIDNSNGYVTCVYTGKSAKFNSRTGANDASFNCEHTWPQSLFNSNEPERADIHHLFPTDVNANSKRANYAFGTVSSPVWSEGGSKLGSSYFEPRNAHKGDVARAMFYFTLRYTNYQGFLTGQETVLRQWAQKYPPSDTSTARNDAIFSYQKNRNPFVDHPEFLERITILSSNSTRPASVLVTASAKSGDLGTYPNIQNISYQYILVNEGNTSLHYSGIEQKKLEFEIDTDSFTLGPGQKRIIHIKLRPNGQLGEVRDTLTFMTSDNRYKMDLPLRGKINSLASVPALQKGFRIQVSDNSVRIYNAVGMKYEVYSMGGSLVYLNEITSSFTELPMDKLSPGLYFVVVIGNNGERAVKKFHLAS